MTQDLAVAPTLPKRLQRAPWASQDSIATVTHSVLCNLPPVLLLWHPYGPPLVAL
jgi:hypothetical protein